MSWRRYEILLPLQFNDGHPIPSDWLESAVLEVVDRFGAASPETQPLAGHWQKDHVVYRDNLVRLVVDTPDCPENRAWMTAFKARWQQRLEQQQLWMISHPIEVET